MDASEIIYDHYKETDELRRNAQSKRDKNFVCVCILEAFSFFLLIEPEEALTIFLNGINSQLETSISLGLGVLQTLLWILVIYVTIQYIQAVLYVERSYRYQSKLEKELSQEIRKVISREGGTYTENYPMVSNFIDLFYKMFCPILFLVINSVHIYKEWIQMPIFNFRLVCDTVLYVALFVILWFYFFEIHSKITNWCKMHIPGIKFIADKLRKLLKEV
ncbi:MAG: hypothetical protein HFI69_11975 [Lachnospiraceae bacterium]|nr:hypothetical protein [Lachnospiraceae bacterium]